MKKKIKTIRKIIRSKLPALLAAVLIISLEVTGIFPLLVPVHATAPVIEQQINIIDQQAAHRWWNLSYTKRKQLTITAGTAVTTGYTTKYSASGADAADIYNDSLASGDDVRVLYWNGSSWVELDRDLFTFTSSAVEVWWALSAAISAGASDLNYYIYYGYASAGAPPANLDNVYRFQDQFNAASLDTNKWNKTSTVTQTGTGVVTIGGTFAGNNQIISKTYTIGDGILEYRYRVTVGSFGYEISPFFRSSVNTGNAYGTAGTQGSSECNSGCSDANFFHAIVVANVAKANGAWNVATNTWYYHKNTVIGVSLDSKTFTDGNWGSQLATVTYSDTGGRTTGYVGVRVYTSRKAEVDWLRVRDYVATEPTVTVGTEDTPATYFPSDNRFGIINFDPAKYNGETVYLDFVYSTDGSTFTRARSSPITMPGTAKNFTVRVLTGDGASQSPTIQLYNVSDSSSTSTTTFGAVSDTQVFIRSARLIIVQSASQITDTQTQVEVGNAVDPISGTWATLSDHKIYYYDSTKFAGTPSIYFEATLHTDAAGNTASARLIQCTSASNCTTGSAVTGSQVDQTGNTNWTRQRTSSTVSLTSGQNYAVQVNMSASTGGIANAKIIIEQTAGGGITDLEVVHEYNNTLTSHATSTYTSKSFSNSLDKANNWVGGTFAAYFESTIKTDNASNAYFARLDTPLGEVTATDTTYTRKRSADIWSSLPGTATNIDVQLKNASTSTTSSANSWLIIQISALGAGGAAPTKVVFTNAARTLTAGACNGDADVLTIQLQDAGSTPTNPTGTTIINVTSNSPSETVYSDNGCTSATNDFTFTTAQNTKSVYIKDNRKSSPTWTLTATKTSGPDTIADGTQSITINAGSVTRLVVTLPSQSFTDGVGNSGSVINQTAGSSFVITKISATDDYFNVNTGYSGAKTLAYAGPGNAPDTTPPSYTTGVSFTSGQSTTTLTTILYKAETPTITATDGGLYGYASSSLTVDAGAINNYLVSAATPQTAAVCFTGTNTVTARDAWNNTRTVDTSVVNMTTSGTSITFYTSAGCSGVTTQYTMSSGQVTMYIKTPKKQSGITVTATRDGFTETGTSGSITVDPAAANAILVKLPGQTFTDGTGISGSPSFSGLRTPNATAGVSFTVDLKAVDANNNLVDSGSNNYTGSKTISFTDSVAGNAPDSTPPSFPGSPVTFTSGAANSLTITYYNAAASRTVEADDTGTPVSGTTSTTFTVQAGSENNYGVSASTPQTAGVAFNVTVTARDSWNNSLGSLYSAPAGTYIWTTTAGNAPDTTAPVIGTLIQGNFASGVATKSVTLYKAESGVTFTAGEPSPSTVTGTSSGVTVNPGSISADPSDSTVTGNASVNTDINTTITITLKDTWRNPKSSVPAADVVLGATAIETITQPSSATDASGVTTGQIKWSNVGDKTVTVTIQNSTLVQNDGTTPDADGKLDDTHTLTVVLSANVVEIKGGVELRGGSLLGQ